MARIRVPIQIEKMYVTTVVVEVDTEDEQNATAVAETYIEDRCDTNDEGVFGHLPWKFRFHVCLPEGEDHGEDADYFIGD